MGSVVRYLRARVTTVALMVALAGGAVGIEAAATHLSGELTPSAHSEPAPSHIDDRGATPDTS